MLYKKIQVYLSQNNIDIKNVNKFFEIKDLSDGNGAFIDVWDNVSIGISQPTQAQLDAIDSNGILLNDAKISKKAELKTYYSSGECWTYKLKSNLLGASITREANWFAKMLPAINGNFELTTDLGSPILVNITSAQAQKINNQINVVSSMQILTLKNQCETQILDATSIEEVDAIDVKESLGAIPREINVDEIISNS